MKPKPHQHITIKGAAPKPPPRAESESWWLGKTREQLNKEASQRKFPDSGMRLKEWIA